ncbi:hypothetical protein UP06_32840 [Bradyrhizobium sp. LTSP857]|nr:hypothetical protein UP06_32840 [Bradyrhizobium sp. LTSP857]
MPVMTSRGPELNPRWHDHRRDGKRRGEPFFGHGAVRFLAELIVSVGALGLLLIVLLLTASVKEKASRLIYGGSQRSQALEPGESRVIDGYKIKRID